MTIMADHEFQPETLAIHADGGSDPTTGAVVPPLHLSTTFEHAPDGQRRSGQLREGGADRDHGQADHQFRHSERLGDGNRAVHEPLRAKH